MPATSRRAQCLARRSSSGRCGSPSKSMRTKSSRRDQHLAEVQVAVEAGLEAGGRQGRGARHARAELRRGVDHAPGERSPAARPIGRGAAPAARACGRIRPAPPLHCARSAACTGSGSKAAVAAAPRQRDVQLGDALRQQLHAPGHGADARRCRRRRRASAPSDSSRRTSWSTVKRPGVALVRDLAPAAWRASQTRAVGATYSTPPATGAQCG